MKTACGAIVPGRRGASAKRPGDSSTNSVSILITVVGADHAIGAIGSFQVLGTGQAKTLLTDGGVTIVTSAVVKAR